MRELKFRAWSLGNKMKGIEPHYIEDFAIDAFYGTPEDIFDGSRSEDGIECIEQYTGLKDKNGKEIYEGDIIQTQYMNAKGWVVWNDGAWSIRLLKYRLVELFLAEEVGVGCEVVGNIHENGDLLGGKK